MFSRIAFSLLLTSLLTACVSRYPAPVSGLNKDYDSVERGSYRGSYYEVQKGDTLYFIAYLTDKNVNDLIVYNQLDAPYTIFPGQKLKLWGEKYVAPQFGKVVPKSKPSSVAVSKVTAPAKVVAAAPAALPKPTSNLSKNSAPKAPIPPKKVPSKEVEQSKPKEYVVAKGKETVNKPAKSITPVNKTVSNAKVSKWLWPTKGRVIENYSAGEQGNKGIDIAGRRGQSIVSTASGTVVYSGNALRGYGNLIIIKHNDNYLSAYAHNDQLLVKEGQGVKAGQKIATMGSSGSKSVRLHFEIRYQGKSVNPKRYLP
ncbi:murein hydrolase activator NlpD [Vibrio sp. SM6]|uniref:Murein hydrolase activator NlpD n=1 Tax=Vibrio agarilyticus TaxID=2726741 RepID=A0A7X8TQD7_9VIBR|nr:murein hydrolase activator NlpD [Vibrio agarilyticus]NLS12825.1 murein hydrolase activator NlpD [Vibrio agarilyticus]